MADNYVKISPSGLLAFRQHSQAGGPSPTDDRTKGFRIFSEWIDTTGPTSYICVDDTPGAAVWQTDSSGGPGYTTIQDEGVPLPQRTTLDVVGGGAAASDVAGTTQLFVPGYNGTFEDNGVPLPQRETANFIGLPTATGVSNGPNVAVTDVAGVTTVTIENTPEMLRFGFLSTIPNVGTNYLSPDVNGTVLTALDDAWHMVSSGSGGHLRGFIVQHIPGGLAANVTYDVLLNGVLIPGASVIVDATDGTPHFVTFSDPGGALFGDKIVIRVTNAQAAAAVSNPRFTALYVPNSPIIP